MQSVAVEPIQTYCLPVWGHGGALWVQSALRVLLGERCTSIYRATHALHFALAQCITVLPNMLIVSMYCLNGNHLHMFLGGYISLSEETSW